jgi:hypothetical protein
MAIALILSGAMISGSAYALKPGCTAPPCGGGGGEPEPTQGNNLSFPAIAVDGYSITPITATLFNVAYTGDYPGLTAAEIAGLVASGPWYPQKTTGNTWQADYQNAVGPVEVTYVDWGDNVESNNPKVRRPFRLEVQLYKQLNEWDVFNNDPSTGMTGYNMAVLEYPSSANELQGTNKITYEGNFATVVSPRWGLRIQYCGDAIPDNLYWNGERWLSPTASCSDVPVSFAVELNVGVKLIFGASEGGWKPDKLGSYRITFFGLPGGPTNLSLSTAEIGNYSDFSVPPAPIAPEADEGGAATPVVDSLNNLSYVDVKVISGGGGSGGSKPPSAGE